MSTILYLQCKEHGVDSDEVGRNTSWLKEVRELISQRAEINVASQLLTKLDFDIERSIDSYRGNAFMFLSRHPICDITIVDEYGAYYSLEDDSPKPVTANIRNLERGELECILGVPVLDGQWDDLKNIDVLRKAWYF